MRFDDISMGMIEQAHVRDAPSRAQSAASSCHLAGTSLLQDCCRPARPAGRNFRPSQLDQHAPAAVDFDSCTMVEPLQLASACSLHLLTRDSLLSCRSMTSTSDSDGERLQMCVHNHGRMPFDHIHSHAEVPYEESQPQMCAQGAQNPAAISVARLVLGAGEGLSRLKCADVTCLCNTTVRFFSF